jgi:tetratricopeptide (TPR) repeat protein
MLTLKPAVDRNDKAEILRSIAWDEPTPLRKHDKSIPAELETITLKCLAKEPGERYATAGELAEDLRRWQSDQTIKAKPPGWREKAAKWGRRHRGLVRAATVMVLLGFIGLSVATWLIWREKENTRIAKDRAQSAEKISTDKAAMSDAVKRFLLEDLLDQANIENQSDRGEAPNRDLTLKEAVNRAAKLIDERFRGQPLLAAETYWTIGLVYASFGDYELAVEHLKKASDLSVQARGPDQPETLTMQSDLAIALLRTGNANESIQINEQVLEKRKSILGAEHTATLYSMANLGEAYVAVRKYDPAISLYGKVLEVFKATIGETHKDTLVVLNKLGEAYRISGKYELAAPILEQCLTLQKAHLAVDHIDTITTTNNLALVYKTLGNLDSAIRLFEQNLKTQQAKFPVHHPNTLGTMENLAGAYHDAGRWNDALTRYEEVLPLLVGKLGPDHPRIGPVRINLSLLYQEVLGDSAKAEEMCREVLARRDHFGTPAAGLALCNCALILVRQKRFVEAEACLTEYAQITAGRRIAVVWGKFVRGCVSFGQGKYSEAEPNLVEAFELMNKNRWPTAFSRKYTAECLDLLVGIYEQTGNADKAAEWQKKRDDWHAAEDVRKK